MLQYSRISFLSFILLVSFCSTGDHKNYVTLNYGGPSDKPLRGLVLYVDTFDIKYWMDEGQTSYSAFKISKPNLDTIVSTIRLSDNVVEYPSEEGRAYYNFTVYQEGKHQRLIVRNKTNTVKLLNKLREAINSAFGDAVLKKNVTRIIDDNLNGLW